MAMDQYPYKYYFHTNQLSILFFLQSTGIMGIILLDKPNIAIDSRLVDSGTLVFAGYSLMIPYIGAIPTCWWVKTLVPTL